MRAVAIVLFEFFEQRGAEHTFALAVDEDNATAFVFGILAHSVVESLDLHCKNVYIRQSTGGIE